MIVVTGSARTGTSLMMRILKEIGFHVPAPKFPEQYGEKMDKYNPLGFYEIPEDQETGIQHHEYKGCAVKLFGYALDKTPRAYVSNIIVCRRNRAAAVKSSIDVFETLYARPGKSNHTKGVEDQYFDVHYRYIDNYVKDFDHLSVNLEDIQLNPAIELRRIANFLVVPVGPVVLNNIAKSIHK